MYIRTNCYVTPPPRHHTVESESSTNAMHKNRGHKKPGYGKTKGKRKFCPTNHIKSWNISCVSAIRLLTLQEIFSTLPLTTCSPEYFFPLLVRNGSKGQVDISREARLHFKGKIYPLGSVSLMPISCISLPAEKFGKNCNFYAKVIVLCIGVRW